jgi:Mn-dependent DtxR family transcriptional regulator
VEGGVPGLRDGEIHINEKSIGRERLGTLDERSTRTEDYVEIIDQLIQMKGYARGIEIAEKLRVRQPTVTSMLQRLAGKGLVLYEKHRGVILTSPG